MTHVKSLVALSIEKMLLKTSGATFLTGIAFMYSAGLSPERITVLTTESGKFILQFHSRCDIRPFAANYPEFKRLLRGIVHIKAWKVKSIEFQNVAFKFEDVPLIKNAIDQLKLELVLLNNCTYPGITQGPQAMRLFSAFNRNKETVVCEYGDERLKQLIRACRPSAPAVVPAVPVVAGVAVPVPAPAAAPEAPADASPPVADIPVPPNLQFLPDARRISHTNRRRGRGGRVRRVMVNAPNLGE